MQTLVLRASLLFGICCCGASELASEMVAVDRNAQIAESCMSTTVPDQGGGPSCRFGGPFAPWNIPAATLPTAPNSSWLVDRLWDHTSGRFNLNSRKWTVAIYDAGEANTKSLVETKYPDWGNLHGRMAPWNPDWQIPDDSDAMVSVVDYDTGLSWSYWGNTRLKDDKILAGTASVVQESIDTEPMRPADVFAKENGYRVNRASGLPYVFMTVTRAELEAGHIPHALTLLWPHPAQYAYVGPAIKGAGKTGGPSDRLPMGTRFVWEIPDEDIEAWASTLDPTVRPGMKAIAVALRDYGGIGTDHAGRLESRRGAIWIEHDFSARWDEIGFSKEATFKALDKLLSRNKHRARAIAACAWPGGDENKVCCYPNDSVDYPAGHECNP